MSSKQINSPNVTDCLCSPCDQFSCFACCPPIRPVHYEHLSFRSSLSRLFVENRLEFLKGKLPQKQILGFFCPGLGFLDPGGHQIGCLLHPMRNNGEDLRFSTGYQKKCERESCPQFRAYKKLDQRKREYLINLCRGMNSFEFSSQKTNPIMRLLAFGPQVVEAAVNLCPADLKEMKRWPFIFDLEPFYGWALSKKIERKGCDFLVSSDCCLYIRGFVENLKQMLEPMSTQDQGALLNESLDEWQARFWRTLTKRNHALPYELAHWKSCFRRLLNTY